MYLFCAKCSAQYPDSGRCPKCSSRLLTPGEMSELMPAGPSGNASDSTQQSTLVGRAIVGTLVALGLHLAFGEWVAGFCLLGSWSLAGIEHAFVHAGLRIAAITVGGLLAGAGRKRSWLTGAIVGWASGLAWCAFEAPADWRSEKVPLTLGVAFGSGVFGAIVAAFGGWIWPPARFVPVPVAAPRASSMLRLKPDHGRSLYEGPPTSWVRIMIAVTLALATPWLVGFLREYVLRLPSVFSAARDPRQLMYVQAMAFLVLLAFAGLVGGSATGSGFRHGLWSGLIGAIGLTILHAVAGEQFFQSATVIADWIGLDSSGTVGLDWNRTTLIALGSFGLILLGSLLGGQLVPPISKKKSKKRRVYD